MAAKSAEFIARTSGGDLRFHPAGGAEVVDLGGGIVGIPVHRSDFIEGDDVTLTGFAAYSGTKTLTEDSDVQILAFADTFTAERLTGLEYVADADLAAGHHFGGGWQPPGSDTYPATNLVDETGNGLTGTISGATWTSGVAPTSARALTLYHAKHALQGRSDVGTVGRSAGVITGQPGSRLDASGMTWPPAPLAHVTRGHPSTSASDIILEILDSFEGGFYVTGAGVVTFGRILDPFDLAADHEILYLDLVGKDPSSSWQSTESEDPPRVLDMPFGAVSFTESSSELLELASVRDRNTWKAPFRILSLPVPGADDLFQLSTDEPAVQTAWWATEAGARDEVRRRGQILRFRRLAVMTEVSGQNWLIVHPITGKELKPFETVEIQHAHAEHLSPGGTVKAVLWHVRRDLGSQTVKLELRQIRVG